MTRPAWRVWVAVFVVYAALTCGFDVSEGRDDAALARHALRSGTIAMQEPLNPNWVRGVDSQYYSSHDIGNAVAIAPVVYVGDRIAQLAGQRAPALPHDWLAGVALPLAAAAYAAAVASAFYFCLITLPFAAPPATALLMTFALAATTMIAPYSRMLFDGVLAAALIAVALASSVRAAAEGRARYALLAGLLSGAAFATRQPVVLLAAGVFGHLAFDAPASQRWRLLLVCAAATIPAIAWQVWYNAVRTGAFYLPAVSMPQFAAVNGAGNLAEGLAGLLLSPGKSILLYSPLLVLAPFGWRKLQRIAPGLAWGLLAGITGYLAVHAGIRNWAGEWGWGPRYAVPLVMPLMLCAAPAIGDALHRKASARRIVVALAASGLVIQIVAIATNWHYHYSYLVQQGRFDRVVLAWSWSRGQFVEMVVVLMRNLGRAIGLPIDPALVDGASAPTIASGNLVNLWPVVALAAGVPAVVVLLAAAVILTATIVTVRWALRPVLSPSGL